MKKVNPNGGGAGGAGGVGGAGGDGDGSGAKDGRPQGQLGAFYTPPTLAGKVSETRTDANSKVRGWGVYCETSVDFLCLLASPACAKTR